VELGARVHLARCRRMPLYSAVGNEAHLPAPRSESELGRTVSVRAMQTRAGKLTLKRRRAKGRKRLTV